MACFFILAAALVVNLSRAQIELNDY
jgi:hypothetical protein